MSIFFKALEQAERDRHARTHRTVERPPEPEEWPSAPVETNVGRAPHQGERSREIESWPAPPDEVGSGAASPGRAATVRLEQAEALVDDELEQGDVVAPWGRVDEHLVSLLRPSSPEAEHYRALRHTLDQLRQTKGLSVIAVSSPAPGDGRTVTAINTAGALAQAPGTKVLLIDLDLRHGSLAQRLGGIQLTEPGMVDAILMPDLSLDDVVQRHAAYNLSVAPAGSRPPRPDEVLMAPRLGELLAEARRRYDYVVVDTPPIVPALDARAIGQWVDGFLLVVAAHRTPRRLLEDALNLMDPSKMVGLVFHR